MYKFVSQRQKWKDIRESRLIYLDKFKFKVLLLEENRVNKSEIKHINTIRREHAANTVIFKD